MLFQLTCYFFLMLSYSPVGDAAEVAVIASANVGKLNEQQVKSLFSLKQKLLPNNQRARLLHLPMSDQATIAFARRLYDLYPYQLQRLWDRQIYSGRAVEPKQVDAEQALFEAVVSGENIVAYVSAGSPLLTTYAGEINVIAHY